MGIFTQLIGADRRAITREVVDSVIGALDQLFTSDEEREQAKQALLKLQQQPAMEQVSLNKIEAKHLSIFVAGWRPFIGWVCGIGLAFTFLVNPVIQWLTGEPGPTLSTDIMFELVIAMLGLSGLRTYEKIKNVAS